MGVKQILRAMDAFPRAEEHLLQKTKSGAFVSIVGLVIMSTLFLHELSYYLNTITVHQMAVDLRRGETLPIHINMTFPSLPCDVLSVDAIDMSGKHEVDLDTNIWKLRLNSDGHITGTEYLSDLVEKEHKHETNDHLLQSSVRTCSTLNRSVYLFFVALHGLQTGLSGSVTVPGNKFKACNDHKDHHDDSDNKTHMQGFDQDAENLIKKVKQALAHGEGCRVYGVLDVQRVAGNFHMSVHGLNIFVAQKIFGGTTHVNVSHIIHDLSFGPKYPGGHNPLDGTERILRGASGTFKYYIKV
ncbi:hypothetical protein H5410_037633 [Solanum commersonii]|uniref:Endoplasmic reticulum-Golgi intermediate compartment protein 3 n=1 Tax=Solanum commersonii TaxID=4109 RepID=A0A9J5Y7Q1_SOLCO|nr:hypothetical protein H5410_037633 [Solanum commersonii]